jgi:hypothetical protein
LNSSKFSNIQPDAEFEAYMGHNLQWGSQRMKLRKAKITPKKIGQFVTLWKRNAQGITVPFDTADGFDIFAIYVVEGEKHGFFLFTRQILGQKQVLSNVGKEGKRGFRVYPPWAITTNKQAQQTQHWQVPFFVALQSIPNANTLTEVLSLLQKIKSNDT